MLNQSQRMTDTLKSRTTVQEMLFMAPQYSITLPYTKPKVEQTDTVSLFRFQTQDNAVFCTRFAHRLCFGFLLCILTLYSEAAGPMNFRESYLFDLTYIWPLCVHITLYRVEYIMHRHSAYISNITWLP